jgi:hypothetical protein
VADVTERETHLYAALAAASASDLAHTTNALLAAERDRALGLAGALVRLCNDLTAIPDYARTVAVDDALRRVGLDYTDACDGLAGRWYDLPGQREPRAEAER